MAKQRFFFQRVYDVVSKIPQGRVATYGQIAALIGSPKAARTVGWALHALTEIQAKKIPWHRVINRKGVISTTCLEHAADEQEFLLVREGVTVRSEHGVHVIDLPKYQWNAS